MTHYTPSLITSFPWLTEIEAAGVAQLLGEVDQSTSAADQIANIAAVLENAGLPPTSTLLLNLAGRGSKATAVEAARSIARARFERARTGIRPAQDVAPAASAAPAPALNEIQVREVAHAAVEAMLAMMPGVFASGAGDDRVLKLLEGLSGEVRWLRSTIDTERQLRRYREVHGPLPEHQAAQGPATTAERRDVVQRLANSLERERFVAHVARIDSADGIEE
ncbi:hypothetical protein [Massilia orientalis]|uniref:Uncharacterized protein n=1 Tax=Massilia orientalis TaxID=3050128 RepID=A0ACC7MFH2_9BURK|nr:hypothetical protein [Massilia sp. YIM B02787]